MRKIVLLMSLSTLVLLAASFSGESLRAIYSRDSSQWPKPRVDEGQPWTELGVLPPGPLEKQTDSLKDIIELGKTLFFDPRLSASGTISCATCHQPELNWTDRKQRSVGHEGAVNKRNAPTIANSWFYPRLFWDGRARDLQDQAFAPIVSESEMNSDMPDLMAKLRNINGYKRLFQKAYGDETINPERMTGAIAIFEKTVVSGQSAFDRFLAGDKKALTNRALRGLHIFRTKAGCMNCHHGPLFTDGRFHRNGLTSGDEGYYKVTHREEDREHFKTPSLRDVARTGPWMHDGSLGSLEAVIERYTTPPEIPGPAAPLIRINTFTDREKADLLAFLRSISAAPVDFQKPVLPE